MKHSKTHVVHYFIKYIYCNNTGHKLNNKIGLNKIEDALSLKHKCKLTDLKKGE